MTGDFLELSARTEAAEEACGASFSSLADDEKIGLHLAIERGALTASKVASLFGSSVENIEAWRVIHGEFFDARIELAFGPNERLQRGVAGEQKP